MGTARMLSYLSTACFCVAAVLVVAAVIQWFRLHIWDIINDLNGKTRAKQIEQLQQESRKVTIHAYEPKKSVEKQKQVAEPNTFVSTELLDTDEITEVLFKKASANGFIITESNVIVHTQEVI